MNRTHSPTFQLDFHTETLSYSLPSIHTKPTVHSRFYHLSFLLSQRFRFPCPYKVSFLVLVIASFLMEKVEFRSRGIIKGHKEKKFYSSLFGGGYFITGDNGGSWKGGKVPPKSGVFFSRFRNIFCPEPSSFLSLAVGTRSSTKSGLSPISRLPKSKIHGRAARKLRIFDIRVFNHLKLSCSRLTVNLRKFHFKSTTGTKYEKFDISKGQRSQRNI